MSLLAATIQWELSATIDGEPVPGILQASFSSSNSYSADTYSIAFAIGAQSQTDVGYWMQLSGATTAVFAAANGIHTDIVSGDIDAIRIDPINQVAVVEGRDLSSRMIDAYRQQDFVNNTASEIVATIAASHGLSASAAETPGNVGRYFADGYTRLSLGQYSRVRSDWDLVVELARENGYDTYVLGQTLYFRPAALGCGVTNQIDLSSVRTIIVERSNISNENPSARVQSWSSQNAASYSTNSAAGGDGTFLFSAANLTSHQASNLASRYATELSRLSQVLQLEMPWDLTLMPRSVFSFTGTNSPIDGIYVIESIDRTYSTVAGTSQVVRALPTS